MRPNRTVNVLCQSHWPFLRTSLARLVHFRNLQWKINKQNSSETVEYFIRAPSVGKPKKVRRLSELSFGASSKKQETERIHGLNMKGRRNMSLSRFPRMQYNGSAGLLCFPIRNPTQSGKFRHLCSLSLRAQYGERRSFRFWICNGPFESIKRPTLPVMPSEYSKHANF